MKAEVTFVGAFRGKLAVEYVIKDDLDNVKGSNVVTIAVRPGETWEELRDGIIKQFLTRRVAKWALTLSGREQDRQEARKPDTIDNLNGRVEPPIRVKDKTLVVQLNSTQANKLRYPSWEEYQLIVDEPGHPDHGKTITVPAGTATEPTFKVD